MTTRKKKPPVAVPFGAVLFSMALSLGGLWATYRWVPRAVISDINDVVGGYLQTVGTVYAVLLAFVVYVVWSQHNEAAGFVDRESNDLFDLFRLFTTFREPDRTTALRRLQAYCEAIVESEWALMVKGRECETARQGLEAVWDVIASVAPQDRKETALYAEVLSRFNDLSDTRVDRLRASRTRIPSVLWTLLLTGAIVVVGSMGLFEVHHFVPHAVMTAALAGAISHIVYLIYDLDNCFYGYWRVTTEPYEHVRGRMRDVFREVAETAPA